MVRWTERGAVLGAIVSLEFSRGLGISGLRLSEELYLSHNRGEECIRIQAPFL